MRFGAVSAVCLAMLAVSADAEEKSVEERVTALEERLGAPAPAAGAAGRDVIETFFKDGLQLRAASGDLEAHIGGTFVFYGRFFIRNNERVQSDTFQIRQARIVIEGKLFNDWEFRVQPTASNGGNFALDDGYLGLVRWGWLKVRVGQFKAPFGMEQLTLDPYTDFPERSLADRLVPSREIGIMVHGEPVAKVLSYAVMLSNGTGRSSTDENSDKDLTARAWVRPGATSESDWIKGLHFGLAGTYGRQDKSAGVLPYSYSELMTGTTFAVAGPNAAAAKFDRSRIRFAAEFAWLWGPVGLKAEYIRTRDKYTVTGPDRHQTHTNHSAGYVNATVLVTGDAKTWERVRPGKPLFGEKGGIGALEIAARWSRFRIQDDLFDDGILDPARSAQEADEYALGVNWYPNSCVRVTAAYALVVYNGDPIRPVVIDGRRIDDEDVILVRIQVDF